MSPLLVEDAKRVHRALEEDHDQSAVVLSREALERIARWLDAEAQGHEVVVTQGTREVTPTDAAAMLGMSRAQVRKLMDQGKLPFRMVGAHHRIRLDAIDAWLRIEDARQEAAMAELMALQNELGLFE
ncbi:MAG: helix-turn-helix domain-containing protein [Propionibacteriaceae bacterium]|jgi:excisionase family DNA binding protein|nr:helix-turn-helix domain-containing protein [Propionibacteriaceae bacterium]